MLMRHINCCLLFSLILLTIPAPLLSGENTKTSEYELAHTHENNGESYFSSMFSTAKNVLQKISRPILRTALLFLLVSGTAAEATNGQPVIHLNPHALPRCYADSGWGTSDYYRSRYQTALLVVGTCKVLQSKDCADICSSDHTALAAPAHQGEYLESSLLSCPDNLPPKSNFALCPYSDRFWEKLKNYDPLHEQEYQYLLHLEKPLCPNDSEEDMLPLPTLDRFANITAMSLCPDIVTGSSYYMQTVSNATYSGTIGVTYAEEGDLPHQQHRYNMSVIKDCPLLKSSFKHHDMEGFTIQE